MPVPQNPATEDTVAKQNINGNIYLQKGVYRSINVILEHANSSDINCGGAGGNRLGVRRPPGLAPELISPFCVGSPWRRLGPFDPDLEKEEEPLAAASNADLQSLPGEGGSADLGLSAAN
nr:hypothetical protein Iba_chr07aCG10650 [Ipomoea batatas]GMD16529.1 hypothetical protein Iba_chr07cCG10290 [Ipomoea batatas]GMD18058.1 hypothetical protein Iba_chr07dCG9620 [Ipomoea batatas]GME01043.1 hypothetical protein Iba_contig804CG0010 [Ipomoea batatas]